jgi:hypothetical protein
MKKMILMFALIASLVVGQEQPTATVVKWEMESFSQSADIIRNHVVYFLDLNGKHYKIARKRREEKPAFQSGDHIQVRFENGFCYIVGSNGKGEKYQILGVE